MQAISNKACTVPEEPTVVCLVCGATSNVFFETQNVPVCCNILWPTRAAAVSVAARRYSTGVLPKLWVHL